MPEIRGILGCRFELRLEDFIILVRLETIEITNFDLAIFKHAKLLVKITIPAKILMNRWCHQNQKN